MAGPLDPIVTKIRMMIGRGVLSLVDDAKKMQAVQIDGMEGETLDDIERPQPYGFTSKPLPGAEAFMMFVGGDRSHGIAIMIDDRRYRLKPLEDGEVALYSHEGSKVVLRNGRRIEVSSDTVDITAAADISIKAGASITLDSPEFTVKSPKVDIQSSEVSLTASSVAVHSAEVDMSGFLSVSGELTGLAGSAPLKLSSVRSSFNRHTHYDNEDNRPTTSPIGARL